MSTRSTRYHIQVTRADNSVETIEARSRRVDALRRCRAVASDRAGWPTIVAVSVIDTNASILTPRILANVTR
jgi:hypothetical protein